MIKTKYFHITKNSVIWKYYKHPSAIFNASLIYYECNTYVSGFLPDVPDGNRTLKSYNIYSIKQKMALNPVFMQKSF